ncbi:hypothetical protein [Treponema phagedenis]|uniref:hypothetical protein n=1 Tax=Treponema phagedenis TaxID=162 RepID=UPI0001F63D82|nr:hypothetical protein [Treponema phagedenis]EFW38486.1 hypothetical protein HMPREF9554_01031 [Treponema phagedenis F0421]TYT79035.1 hypothetical protein FS559_07895 [Treponema phagedenis]
MKKKLFFTVWFGLFGFAVFANSYQVIKTKYFDIIYGKTSEQSALLLAKHADSYAEEISARLNTTIKARTPVFLRATTEGLNGYYTPLPYNRIVLFDVRADDGVLGNIEQTLLKVFYHELTHRISLDFFTPMMMPLSFVEGVAVSFESLDGKQGRLNDPLVMHYLIQGKIDNTSPSWREAASAPDVYPGGLLPYLYGGAFSAYLQKIYGAEKYAELWHKSWKIFPNSKFKSIFNRSIEAAWDDFIDTIPVPKTIDTPQQLDSKKTNGIYAAPASSEKGFAYYDSNKQVVYFYGKDESRTRLFSHDRSLEHLSFSSDGRYLLVSDSISGWTKDRKRVRIYDTVLKKFESDEYLSHSEAAFGKTERQVCLVKIENQNSALVLRDRNFPKDEKVLFEAGPEKEFASIYNPAYAGDDLIAFIAANGVRRSLLFVSLKTGEISQLPQEQTPYAIRYLQSNKTANGYVLTFSWAEMNMLYRFGMYDMQTKTLRLSNSDISGGVFFPVVYTANKQNPQGGKTDIAYTGIHGNYMRFYRLSSEKLEKKPAGLVAFTGKKEVKIPTYAAKSEVEEQVGGSVPSEKPLEEQKDKVPTNTELSETETKAQNEIDFTPKRYHPIAWLWRAKVLPAVTIPGSDRLKDFGKYGLGLATISLDPAETIELRSRAVFYFKPFFTAVQFASLFHTKQASFGFSGYDTIDSHNFLYRKTGLGANTQISFPTKDFRQSLGLNFNVSADWYADLDPEYTAYLQYYHAPHKNPILTSKVEFAYSFLQSTNLSTQPFFSKNICGAEVAVSGLHAYNFNSNKNSALVQAKGKFRLPVVPLSFSVSGYFGYNAGYTPGTDSYIFADFPYPVGQGAYLPSLTAYTLQKLDPNTDMYTGLGVDAELTVFSYDIQKGSSWLPIFYNRIKLNIGYAGVLNFAIGNKKAFSYKDIAKGNIMLTINGVDVGLQYSHPLREKKKFGTIDFVFDLSF